jgi:hypothetical protein
MYRWIRPAGLYWIGLGQDQFFIDHEPLSASGRFRSADVDARLQAGKWSAYRDPKFAVSGNASARKSGPKSHRD